MRILFVVPYTPNLVRVRPFNLIRYLTENGHQVVVLTLISNPEEQVDAAALAEQSQQVISLPLSRWRSLWNCLIALPTNKPLQSVYCWQPELAGQLTRLAHGYDGQLPFDVIHVEHLRGARYGLHINKLPEVGNSPPPIVWDSVDCISELFRQASAQSQSAFGRWVTRLELGRTERYESWLLGQFSHVLVTSPVDKQALTNLEPSVEKRAPITVLPNGVDLDYFKPDPSVNREPATLVVSGKMSYHANVTMVLHLAQNIMPRVWEKQQNVKLLIVGKDPPSDIQQLAQHPSISVTGTVADLRPYLRRATIAVAPITYGAGIQNKVLEAMACATPVIVTPQATQALAAVPEKDLLVAGDAQAFADQILNLLEDPERQRILGENGRVYIESHHHWGTITRRLEEVYKSII